MIGWPENAFAGQKVVCVDGNIPKNSWEVIPETGKIYTIRTIEVTGINFIALTFVEIINPQVQYADEFGEVAFRAQRFRPVQTRDTSAQVEALKRLALSVHDEVRA